MPDYRLYCLDGAGKITKVHEIPAATDEQALAIAKDLKLPTECELWDKGRMVAKLDAHP